MASRVNLAILSSYTTSTGTFETLKIEIICLGSRAGAEFENLPLQASTSGD